MQYKKDIEIKVVRTTHKITLFFQGSIYSLMKVLDNIPENAKLIDVDEDENGNTVLIFQEEKEEEQDGKHQEVIRRS